MKKNNPAKIYRDNSHIQSTNAETFLDKYAFLGDEKILDIGCGDGRITQFISNKSPSGIVHGIDISKHMIDLATRSFPHVSFECVDALEYHSLEKYDIITCLSTLHWFLDQEAFFNKVKRLLRYSGKVYILAYSPVDSYWKPMEDCIFSNKWKRLVNQSPFYCQLGREELTEIIQKSGLSIESFESIQNRAFFKGKEAYIQHICGFLPHLQQLPTEYHEEFLNEIGANFLNHNFSNSDGSVSIDYETYEIVLKIGHSI